MESKINKILSSLKFNDEDINKLNALIESAAEKDKEKQLEALGITNASTEETKNIKGNAYYYYVSTLISFYNKAEGNKKKYPENVRSKGGEITIDTGKSEIKVKVDDGGKLIANANGSTIEIDDITKASILALTAMGEGSAKELTKEVISGEKKINKLSSLNKNAIKSIAREKYSKITYGGVIRVCKMLGVEVTKKWVTMEDERVRTSHEETNGQKRKITEEFNVLGNEAMYPRDGKLPLREKINCRCILEFEKK